jgi:hypothetical protein
MIMKVYEMFRKSVMGAVIHGSIIGCGLVVVGSALVPAVASARSVTADEIKAIKKRLVNATTREELVSALKEAKSDGAPWQMLFESTVLYTLKTGDYSMLEVIKPHLQEYVDGFSVTKSLLFNSETEAAVFLRVFAASVDLYNGNEESAAENLRKAKELDPVAFKQILPYAMTIQKYINA